MSINEVIVVLNAMQGTHRLMAHFMYVGCLRLNVCRWHWGRVSHSKECLVGYKNQIIHIAFAYIELEQRRPIDCHRIEGIKYRINSEGTLDEHYTVKDLISPLDTLMEESEKDTTTVIRAETLFKMKRCKDRCTWRLSKEDIGGILALIWRN